MPEDRHFGAFRRDLKKKEEKKLAEFACVGVRFSRREEGKEKGEEGRGKGGRRREKREERKERRGEEEKSRGREGEK